MPDFDVDFCYERRQEVIDYVNEKYGRDHVAPDRDLWHDGRPRCGARWAVLWVWAIRMWIGWQS